MKWVIRCRDRDRVLLGYAYVVAGHPAITNTREKALEFATLDSAESFVAENGKLICDEDGSVAIVKRYSVEETKRRAEADGIRTAMALLHAASIAGHDLGWVFYQCGLIANGLWPRGVRRRVRSGK